MSILDDAPIRDALRKAWEDSQPDTPNAHEEGGFVLRVPDGALLVERWPSGSQRRIFVPPFHDGRRNGLIIVATFHTHPNSSPRFVQGPSRLDIESVRHNPNLASPEYEGEIVISRSLLYLICLDGSVESIGDTSTLLELERGEKQ